MTASPRSQDVSRREFWLLATLVVAVLALGLYPKPFTDVMHASVTELLTHVAQEQAVMTVRMTVGLRLSPGAARDRAPDRGVRRAASSISSFPTPRRHVSYWLTQVAIAGNRAG